MTGVGSNSIEFEGFRRCAFARADGGATHASPLPGDGDHRGRERHHRRSIRLRGYDYAQAGAYFVTLCTQDRACLFGDVVDGAMRLTDAGAIVDDVWRAIPDHFPGVRVDEYVIMPNHVHGVLVFNVDVDDATVVGATHASPLPGTHADTVVGGDDDAPDVPAMCTPIESARPRGPSRRSLGAVVGTFKSAATKRINEHRGTPGASVWQRNYYEHIVRHEEDLVRIRQYIRDKPAQWAFDRESPTRIEAPSNCGEFDAIGGPNPVDFDGVAQADPTHDRAPGNTLEFERVPGEAVAAGAKVKRLSEGKKR